MKGGKGGTLKQLDNSGNSYFATVEHGKSMELSSVIETESKPEERCVPGCSPCPQVQAFEDGTVGLPGSMILLLGVVGVGGLAFWRRGKKSNQSKSVR